jgi:hypothetical protein
MIPWPVVAAIIGATVGAGKTALNEDQRKDPMSWVTNVAGGAASGAMGGAGAGGMGGATMAGLQGGMSGFGGGGGTPTLYGGVSNEDSIPAFGMGADKEGGMGGNSQMAVDILKTWINRPRAPKTTVNNNSTPLSPLIVSPLQYQPYAQMGWQPPEVQPLAGRRREY